LAGPFVPELFFIIDIEAQADNTTPLVTDWVHPPISGCPTLCVLRVGVFSGLFSQILEEDLTCPPGPARRVAGPFVPELFFFTLDIEARADNTTPLVTEWVHSRWRWAAP